MHAVDGSILMQNQIPFPFLVHLFLTDPPVKMETKLPQLRRSNPDPRPDLPRRAVKPPRGQTRHFTPRGINYARMRASVRIIVRIEYIYIYIYLSLSLSIDLSSSLSPKLTAPRHARRVARRPASHEEP